MAEYFNEVNKTYSKRATVVKKHFESGETLIEEQFIDTDSVYIKENEKLFCVKGLCASSLKKKDQWVTIAIFKQYANVEFAYCQCKAGKTGTCLNSFAVMKILAKWVLDKCKEVPEQVACTSKP